MQMQLLILATILQIALIYMTISFLVRRAGIDPFSPRAGVVIGVVSAFLGESFVRLLRSTRVA
jgi:hypothetical protein